MAELVTSFDTEHIGAVQDCQLDYYGKKLATTSADHSIKLWDISASQNSFGSQFCNNYTNNNTNNHNAAPPRPVFLAELKGHDAPVWQVSWAHPKFGGLIASCSFDRRIIIWREIRQNEWQIVYKCEDHKASVNSVGWCPWEYGLQLACGSSDGYISVLTYKPEINSWIRKAFLAHSNGVNAVSWSSFSEFSVGDGRLTTASGVNSVVGRDGGGRAFGNEAATECRNFAVGGAVGGSSGQKIVSGGCDNQVRIWKLNESSNEWVEIHRLEDKNGVHTDWVRDVSWRPNVGLSSNYIASCSEDETVIIWYQENENMAWKNIQTIKMSAPVWRVTWSVTGNILAVANGDNAITLFKETVSGKFERITSLGENSNTNINAPNMNLSQYNYPNEAPNYEFYSSNNSNNNFAQVQSKAVPASSNNSNNVTAASGGGGGDGVGGGGVGVGGGGVGVGGGGDGVDLKGMKNAHNSTSNSGVQQSSLSVSSVNIMDIGDQPAAKGPLAGMEGGNGRRSIIGEIGVLNSPDNSQNPFSAYSPNMPNSAANISMNGLNQNMSRNIQNSYNPHMNVPQGSPVANYEAINAQQSVSFMPAPPSVRAGGLPSVGAGGTQQQAQNPPILRR